MYKALFIFLLLSLFYNGGKDDFNFPDEFYEVDFENATVDTIISIFGSNCSIDTSFFQGPNRISGCVITSASQTGQISMEYDGGKLRFYFGSRNDVQGEYFQDKKYGWINKFKLESIVLNSRSDVEFGLAPDNIQNYKVSKLFSQYGEPTKLAYDNAYSIYSYCRDETRKEYSFWFNDSTDVLTYVRIEPLTK